ncbi:hypothetical protein MSG28_004467, partial [Choristoneura fumiferana]
LAKAQRIYLGTVYRSPNSDIKSFLNHLESFLHKINIKHNSIICGDFNIDLKERTNIVTDFLQVFLEHNLTPTIHEYTRITETSNTLVDNIFSSTTGIGSQFNADLTNGSIIENSFRSFFSNNGQTMNYDLSEAMQMLNQSYGIPAITNNPEALAALQMEYQNLMIDFQNKLQAKLNGEKSSRPADPVDPSTVSLSGLQQQISTLAAISPHALFVDQDERTKHLPLITRSKLVILHNGSRPDFVIRLANQLLTPSVAQMLPRNTVFKFALSLTLSNTEVTLASSSEKRLCNETRTDKWLGIQSHSKVAIPVKTKGSRHVSSPEIINAIMFVQYGVGAACICVTMCGFVLPDLKIETFIFMVGYFFVMNLQVFVPSWLGTQLRFESQELMVAAYKSDWIPRSKSYRQSIKLFLERAKHPVVITGLKIFPLSLATYISVRNYSILKYL